MALLSLAPAFVCLLCLLAPLSAKNLGFLSFPSVLLGRQRTGSLAASSALSIQLVGTEEGLLKAQVQPEQPHMEGPTTAAPGIAHHCQLVTSAQSSHVSLVSVNCSSEEKESSECRLLGGKGP